jgi:hypothetical protein
MWESREWNTPSCSVPPVAGSAGLTHFDGLSLPSLKIIGLEVDAAGGLRPGRSVRQSDLGREWGSNSVNSCINLPWGSPLLTQYRRDCLQGRASRTIGERPRSSRSTLTLKSSRSSRCRPRLRPCARVSLAPRAPLSAPGGPSRVVATFTKMNSPGLSRNRRTGNRWPTILFRLTRHPARS